MGFILEGVGDRFYNFSASGSGGGTTNVTIQFEEEGGVGYTQDFLADAIRDAIDALAGVTTGTLNKHVDTTSTIA